MPRDGRYIEKLGTYNPLLENSDANRVQLVEERIKYWLSQGAKPSERVAIFLGQAGLAPVPAQSNRPNKSKPSEKTLQLKADKEEKRAAAEEAAKAAAEEAKAAPEAPAEEAPAEEAAPEAEAPAEETPAEEPQAEEAPAEDTKEEDKKEG